MKILETERLILRRLTVADSEFILELLNDPSWLRYIGDKGVRNLDDARGYIRTGPMEMYARFGFGLYLTERKADGAPIGLCGLIKRDFLQDVDLGFAFLPAYRSNGYALESASAVLAYGRNDFGFRRIVAITSPDNDASIRLLGKLGFRFEKMIPVPGAGEEVRLFASEV